MNPEDSFAFHARSFASAARLLGRVDHARIARLDALCRRVDDLADTVGGDCVKAQLTALANNLARADGAQDRLVPLAAEARNLFADRPDGLAIFRHLVTTVAIDTGPTRLADAAELDAYCLGVAGSVGVMVYTLFDVAPRLHKTAADLGCAMQLTNICRDVAEHARAGRRNLPFSLCPHSPSAIMAEDAEALASVKRTVENLLIRADGLYASGRTGLSALPLRLRLAASAATAMYAGIGDELRARDCDTTRGRVFVPGWRKTILAAREVGLNFRPTRTPGSEPSRAAT